MMQTAPAGERWSVAVFVLLLMLVPAGVSLFGQPLLQ
jgi:hypothetical protein